MFKIDDEIIEIEKIHRLLVGPKQYIIIKHVTETQISGHYAFDENYLTVIKPKNTHKYILLSECKKLYPEYFI